MPDRSSRHGLPDEWNHGSHARREYSVNGESDGFGAAKTEAIPAKTDAYGPAKTDTYSPATTDPFASPPGGYGASTADPFGGVSTADPFGSTSTADPFGSTSTVGAEPFGARNTDPFGAAATGAFGTTSFSAEALGAATAGAGAFGAEALGAATAGAGTFSAGAYGAGAYGAGTFGAGTFGAGAAETGTARPGAKSAAAAGDPVPTQATDARSFLHALFDFGFTSFVTPKIVKALYVLIAIGAVASALVFTVFVFKASVAFGIVTLIVADPLFVLIVLAIYRIALEFFMVTFRMAEDIRALRERGDLR